uniref:Origin recognition complex subunit 2 n=1 Tax=Caenorhabditis japonica TaxID=281687 RepID=A0A8R1HLR0_CAEJA
MTRVPVLKRAGTSSTPVAAKKSSPEKSAKRKTRGKENVEEKEIDHKVFEDETVSVASSAIENYFLQGKLAEERMNSSRPRRGKRAGNGVVEETEEEDDGVNKMIAEFTKCDLPGLRDYISQKNSTESQEQLDYLAENEFNKWLLYLASGFNILIHGVGSKRELLSQFEEELESYTYMRVDARKDEVNVKVLLSAINENMKLDCNVKRGQSTIDWAKDIRRRIQKRDLQLILIIDNIESPDWRNDQEAICELLENRRVVKLIATVDHIYSTFIWNSRQLSSLSFVHITVNTLQIPLHEMMTGESRLLGLDARSNQSSHTMSSLDVFWKSLAVNSQKLFRLFFSMYFAAKKPVKFWDLFNSAKDDFIASTDAALRTQLVEFKDHRVLKWTRGDDGNDQLSGMVELKLVTEFLVSKGMSLSEEGDE